MNNTDTNATDYVDDSAEMSESVSVNGDDQSEDTGTAAPSLHEAKTVNADNGPSKQKPRKYHSRQLRKGPETGRNEPCLCGSGAKYKKCCLVKENEQMGKQREMIQNIDELMEAGKEEVSD